MAAATAPIVTCPHCGKRNRVPVVAEGVPRCGNCHQPLPWIAAADAQTFDAAVRASVPVLVDFWAPWCGPCRMVSPIVERVGTGLAGRLKVVKLNVDEAPDIAARYDVQGIPLLVVIRDGNEVDRLVGAVGEQQLRRFVEQHVPASAGAEAH
ncbi:MAG: thioredoxin 2 [Solirubrobacteraceae bacterium]|jgi:thioredoxin 2|nr:thioredoxin 2 [Solirubrobacteraceae bacterium]